MLKQTGAVTKSKKLSHQSRLKRMNGGGRPPTGTPSLAWSSVVIVASLLAGASIVHNIYKPHMVRELLPPPPCRPPVRPNACTKPFSYVAPLPNSFSARADHPACGERQRRRRQGKLRRRVWPEPLEARPGNPLFASQPVVYTQEEVLSMTSSLLALVKFFFDTTVHLFALCFGVCFSFCN